jgi:cell division cycle 2-like
MVMDFADHDLKALMERMDRPFLQAEVKTIIMQILSAIEYMHANWLIHRDLKTSNILINSRGEVKVADFGLTRKYGDPPSAMTQLVVTLWYRAPELLLGEESYTPAIDLWSIGCIYGELVKHEPILPGRSEIDQLNRIFKLLSTPTTETWPGMHDLPHAKQFQFTEYPHCLLQSEFGSILTQTGIDFISKMLKYDPEKRVTAKQALSHAIFMERPYPAHPSVLEKWIADEELAGRDRSNLNPMMNPNEDLKEMYKQLESKSGSGQGFRLKF